MFESRRCSMIDVLGSHISRKQFYEPYNFDAFVSGEFGKITVNGRPFSQHILIHAPRKVPSHVTSPEF